MRVHAFVFTVNNFTAEQDALIRTFGLDAAYFIYGKEVGDVCGTPHLQGYVRFTNARSAKAITNKLEKLLGVRPHVEIAKGSDLQNQIYCSKGTDIFESGTPSKQGRRSDMSRAIQAYEDGNSIHEMHRHFNLQAIRHVQSFVATQPAIPMERTVSWIWGPTGTGKTHYAMQAATNPWVSNGQGNMFFATYANETELILDDFRGEQLSLAILLRVLDKYAVNVRVLYGTRPLMAHTIYITSDRPPSDIWSDGDLAQVMRRINHVIHLSTRFDEG